MFVGRLKTRLARQTEAGDYALALALAGFAVLCRAAVETVGPGVAYFVALMPAVVIAGLFCGTLPGVLAAASGGLAIAVLFLGRPLLAWPPFNGVQIDTLLFIPACAAILWATRVSRRFAAESAAAEARLAEVFRQIPGAAAILEAPDGRLLLRSSQSDATLKQPERPLARADELASYGAIHPDGRSFAPDEYPIVRALRTGEVVNGEPLRYRQPDGRIIDLDVYAGPVRDPDGAIVASVGMAFDVTDKVEATRRLRDSEARIRAALDAGALGLWEFDLTTQRISLDATVAALLGLPPEPVELSRDEILGFADPSDALRANAVLEAAVAAGGIYADEVRMKTVQGTSRWFVSRGVVLTDLCRIVGVISDITERREREEALQAALAAREVLMREADHRIKNSLQLVVSLLRLQLGRVADADARAVLNAAMARVNAVADAHLALQQSQDLRSIEVDRMLRELCSRVGLLNPAVTMQCLAAVGRSLDAEQAIPLGLIASELLTNALRHAFPDGGAGTVRLLAEASGGLLVMTIADDGIGLPSVLPRGLGTSVIDTLARQIGATVTRRSDPRAGTSVRVQLMLPTSPPAEPCLAMTADTP